MTSDNIIVMTGEDLVKAIETAVEIVVMRLNAPTEAKQEDEVLLTRKQVSEMLDVTTVTLSRWEKVGYLPSVTIGRKKRYKKSTIDKLLKERSESAPGVRTSKYIKQSELTANGKEEAHYD